MKPPAYASPLLRLRRAGSHPASVVVVYGERWQLEDGVTRLAVKPGEALGLEWRCVAGLPVEIRAQGPDCDELWRLAGEVACEAAAVTIVQADGARECADIAAFMERLYARPVAWPAWWSRDIDKINERNRQQWFREAEGWLAQCAV